MSLAGLGPVDVTFGAILKQTANFDQFKQIDGVMGFIGSDSSKHSVFSALVTAGAVAEDVWAICLSPGSKSNGTITLGGVDPRLMSGPVAYSPDTGGDGFFDCLRWRTQPVRAGRMGMEIGQVILHRFDR